MNIKRTPQKAHPNTAKTKSFTAKNCPVELVEKIQSAVASLSKDGYIFSTVSFRNEESDFGDDYTTCIITAGRMETQDECDKRVAVQESRNARELQTMKENLHIQQKRKEFERLTAHLSLDQLQALTSLEGIK